MVRVATPAFKVAPVAPTVALVEGFELDELPQPTRASAPAATKVTSVVFLGFM
jgi:hypothetical protein